MSWWRRWFGLHPVEMLVHFTVGGFLIGAAASVAGNMADAVGLLVSAGVLAAYGWRRHRAIAALPPVESISGEVRLAELEAHGDEIHDLRGRMAELEERLDFAERLLSRQAESHQLEP